MPDQPVVSQRKAQSGSFLCFFADTHYILSYFLIFLDNIKHPKRQSSILNHFDKGQLALYC